MPKLPLSIMLTAILVATSCIGAGQGLNRKGKALYKEGKYAEAVDVYREVLKRNPNFHPVHIDLGFAYDKLGKKYLAIQEFHLGIPHISPNCGLRKKAERRLSELEKGY